MPVHSGYVAMSRTVMYLGDSGSDMGVSGLASLILVSLIRVWASNKSPKPGVVAYTCSPSTQAAEVIGAP